ncbi:hypothetical protein QTJ16_004105 [Diplocarpon rosae]|uniref:Uncharacterized protein n=1 Tax=Diplocarpon rosae TaxID=946125 RepID=A0AAD9T258_9HELO|nr:hypothetical protein QTJ16_004105 [Diplocarpon rosae]
MTVLMEGFGRYSHDTSKLFDLRSIQDSCLQTSLMLEFYFPDVVRSESWLRFGV